MYREIGDVIADEVCHMGDEGVFATEVNVIGLPNPPTYLPTYQPTNLPNPSTYQNIGS